MRVTTIAGFATSHSVGHTLQTNDREAFAMPHSYRLTGRFFSVLISLIVAFAIPRPVQAFDGGLTLCQIVEEIFGAKSGATKKAAALSFVNSAVSATDSVAGKT